MQETKAKVSFRLGRAIPRCVGLFLLLVSFGMGGADDAKKGPEARGTTATNGYLCEPGKVCRERATNVPLRVLPRSFSRIYDSDDEGSVKYENIPAFHPMYVFQRRGVDSTNSGTPSGWYQVGRNTTDDPLGWMRAADLLEWRQALILSYTHHGTGEEARQKVVMFQSLEALKELTESKGMERRAARLYEKLRRGEVPENIVSKEPELFVDVMETFYLMPVVEFEKFDLNGEEARYLKVAAAVPGARGTTGVITGPGKPVDLTKLSVNAVFVLDMTKSMQPFMDRTKEALVRLSHLIDTKYGDKFDLKTRFGLVGYRDDTRNAPGLEFTSFNFTPSLVSTRDLVAVLANDVRAAEVSSQGYSEQMFEGVDTALEKTEWDRDAVKFLIVVGDASSHPVGHPQNPNNLNASRLRDRAKDKQIHIMTMHLKDPKFPEDHTVAQTQFETLAQVEGSVHQSYVDIDLSEPDSFLLAVQAVAEGIGERLKGLADGEKPLETDPAIPEASPSQRARLAFDRIFDAALVEYMGRNTQPPKDFVAWVLDRDLTDPAKRTLAVRVLIDRKQLSDLVVGLATVIKSLDRAQITQAKFLEALQELAAQAEKDPAQIAQASKLSETGLLPAFIEGLPYTSEVLSLSNELFAEMTAEQKSGLEGRLRAKLQQYRQINEDVGGWVKLNETDPPADMVYPLNIDALP